LRYASWVPQYTNFHNATECVNNLIHVRNQPTFSWTKNVITQFYSQFYGIYAYTNFLLI